MSLSQFWQSNTNVFNLSKHTFQHQVKLQEPNISFNLASLSQQHLLNTTRNLLHREHVGPLALLVVLLKDARGHYWPRWFTKGCQEEKNNSSHYITLTLICTFDKVLQHDKLLNYFDQCILYFCSFWVVPFNNSTNLNVEPLENKYFVIYYSYPRKKWSILPGTWKVYIIYQVGYGIELEAVCLHLCGVTWDSSQTVMVIKLLWTSALPSDIHKIIHWEHPKKFLFVFCCKIFLKFSTGWISVQKIADTEM